MKGLGVFILFILWGVHCLGNQRIPRQDSLFAGELPSDRMETGYTRNPAAFGWLRQESKGRLAFRYRTDDASGFYSPYDGKGGRTYRAEAYGYGVEEGKVMYSGSAAWENGLRRNTGYTEVRDERLLGPYLVADTLGGNYYHELYHLGGSAAFYAGKGIYGLRATYRGTTAYRKVDPRPENTISELRLNPGMVWRGGRWDVGFFLDYTFYKQHLSVRIEESSHKEKFYILKGFGLYDFSFSTVETSFRRYYRSHEYGGGFQLKQSREYGVSLELGYSHRRMEVEEADLRTPYLLGENKMRGKIGWNVRLEENTGLLLKAEGKYMRQTGREKNYEKTVTDTSTGVYVWRLLSESDKYRRQTVTVAVTAMLQHTAPERLAFWYGIGISGENDVQRYLYPAYRQQLTGIKGTLMAGMMKYFGKQALKIELAGGIYRNLKAELNAPPAEETLGDLWEWEYNYRKTNYYDAGGKLSYSFPLKGRTALAADAAGKYAGALSGRSRWAAEAGLSFIF